MLLHHAERNDTDGILSQHRIGQAPYDLCHHGFGLRTVLLGLSHIVYAVQLHQFYLGDQIVG